MDIKIAIGLIFLTLLLGLVFLVFLFFWSSRRRVKVREVLNKPSSTRARFLNAFSKLAIKHPFLTRIVSSIIIVALWFFFIPTLNSIFIVFSEFFLLQFLLGGVFVIFSIILTVGLLELILKDWEYLQIGLGFLLATLFTYILYFAIGYLTSIP